MPKHRGQIHPDQAVDWAPVETNKAVVGWAMVTAGAAGVLGWWVLRHPEWRAFLVQLVPHRYPIAFAYERQILAPRSLAIGGAVSY
ncbi:MAG: hypothetical protein N2Z21_01840, partial [Candidatus Sumerlaeaceae bacterium]|nr:hypothetical protein [Candidatus Sumerlaeaceae bacterium]